MTCDVLDNEEFGDESGGVWDSAVVAAELDGEEDDAAANGIDGRYVEKVLDVNESVFLGWDFSLSGILENFKCILILIFLIKKKKTKNIIIIT